MIAKDEFDKFAKTRDQLYKRFQENGYWLPVNIKNQFVSKKMLVEVLTKKCHLPLWSELN